MIVRTTFSALFLAVGLVAAGPTRAGTEAWETWQAETYHLQPGQTLQLRIGFAQIPVRAWRLLVESDGALSDLRVWRLKGQALIFSRSGESRHEVPVPWGKGEEISVALTARRREGTFTVSWRGPPRRSAPVSYSYEVNRALEAYAAGQRLQAESLCEAALAENPDDGVAMVMLASFRQDRHFYRRADKLLKQALAVELPPDMRELALQLQAELRQLQAPLSPRLREGLAAAEKALTAGDPTAALTTCDLLLQQELTTEERSRVLRDRARALHRLGRFFEAVDVFTRALTAARSREDQAVIYFRMAELFLDMDNPAQAEGALNIARKYGLPPGLDLRASEALKKIAKNRQ